MRRPPYLRWFAAGVIVMLGMLFETRTDPTTLYPYADSPIAAGVSIDGAITWQEVPAGVLPEWQGDVAGITLAPLAAGDPILPTAVGELRIPPDWWAVAVPLPTPVVAGTPIRVVLTDSSIVEGIALEGAADTGFEIMGTVAFAPSQAPLVAQAAANDALVVMIAADTPATVPDG